MMKYIKEVFGIGGLISIYCQDTEVRGTIEKIDDQFIVLRTDVDNNLVGIKTDTILGFSKDSLASKYRERKGRDRRQHSGVFQHPHVKYTEWHDSDHPIETSLASEPYKSEQILQKEKEIYQEISAIKDEVKMVAETLMSEEPITADKIIPPMGVILELKPSFQFGFIDDSEDGVRYFFNKNDIIDNTLKDVEGEMIEVVYHKARNHKGPAAKHIHRSASIGELLKLLISHLECGSYSDAFAIMESIKAFELSSEYLKQIDEFMEQILNKAQSVGYELKRGKNSLYSEARRRLQNKDYDAALKVYYECLNLGLRKENCIKDILQIYVTTYAQQQTAVEREGIKKKAIDFLEKYKDELPNAQSTYFTIENAYFALGEYEKHIDIAEEIVAQCGRNGELPQYVFYLNKLAQSYYRIGELDKALDAVYQGLDIEPDNQHLIKTMATITEAKDKADDPFLFPSI